MTVPDPISPDCEQKKCTACSGDAWDHLKDQLTQCAHECHRSTSRGRTR